MMIKANIGFRLSAYLNKIDCQISLQGGPTVVFEEIAFTEDCLYQMGYMAHEFWAAGRTRLRVLKDSVGLLRVEYHLFSSPGQGSPSVLETVVPVVARGTAEQRFGSKYESAA